MLVCVFCVLCSIGSGDRIFWAIVLLRIFCLLEGDGFGVYLLWVRVCLGRRICGGGRLNKFIAYKGSIVPLADKHDFLGNRYENPFYIFQGISVFCPIFICQYGLKIPISPCQFHIPKEYPVKTLLILGIEIHRNRGNAISGVLHMYFNAAFAVLLFNFGKANVSAFDIVVI